MQFTKFISLFAVSAALIGSATAQQTTTSQLKTDCQKLVADLKKDLSGSDVTPAEWQALLTALESIESTAHRPNPADVTALEDLLKKDKALVPLTPAEKKQLLLQVQTTLVSAGISTQQMAALRAAVYDIWLSSNFTQAELEQLGADIKAILNDLPVRKPTP